VKVGKCASLCCFLLQTVKIFLGLHAKVFLETGREIAWILESDAIGKVADADAWVLFCQTAGFLHADVADEARHVESCDGA